MKLKLTAIIAIIILLSILILQNTEVVQLRFLIWELAMSRVLMFIMLVIIGMALGWYIRGHKS
jgi:uncharacterized integral membrane protein